MELRLLPYLPERDVYRLLGVPPSADRAAILAACRRLSRTFHPDRSASPRANEEMRVVNAVRSMLTDTAARAEYDRARLRFLSAATRVTGPARPAAAPSAIPQIDHSRHSADLARAARAVMAGLLAGLAALAASRCPNCQAFVEREYRYCGACGRPLLTEGASPPA
jgi:curved DNA-binding protein CbpA